MSARLNRVGLLCLAGSLVAAPVWTEQLPNFSGEWVLVEQTPATGQDLTRSRPMRVVQTADTISVFYSPGNSREMRYPIDGRPGPVIDPTAKRTTATAVWNAGTLEVTAAAPAAKETVSFAFDTRARLVMVTTVELLHDTVNGLKVSTIGPFRRVYERVR